MKEIAKEIFSFNKIKEYFINEMLGRLVGFIVGISTSSLFTKVVYEKKGLNNLFGLAKRKKIVVNTTPEWLQFVFSLIVGYVMLELVNYIIKYKKYRMVSDPIIQFFQSRQAQKPTEREESREV